MPEAIRTSLLVPEQDRVDSLQYDGFLAANIGKPVYKRLTVPAERRDALTEQFVQTGENPDLRATHLDIAALDADIASLSNYKQELLADPTIPDDIRQEYRYKVNEQVGNLRIARASHEGDMRRFRAYNVFVYGDVDPRVFAAEADWFRTYAATHLQSEHASVREAAQEVLSKVEDYGGSRDVLVPDPETFAAVRADHHRQGGYYTLLLAGINMPEKGPITADVGDPVLRGVQQNIGAKDYKIVDANGAGWGTNHNPLEWERPARMKMPLARFVGLGAGHELGSHTLERMNGLRSALGLAALGLERYEHTNEGRALIREQVVYETFDEFAKLVRWQDVMRRGFAIGLGHGANGLDENGKFTVDRQPESFDEVYDVINAVDRLWERVKNPTDTEAADKKAHARTQSLLDRVLKGTDGTGGAYLKDKVYPEGHVQVWEAAKQYGPEVIDHGDRGKYNLVRTRQLEFLQKYKVIPRILEEVYP